MTDFMWRFFPSKTVLFQNRNAVKKECVSLYFETILQNEKCIKVTYNCIKKKNVILTSIHKMECRVFFHMNLFRYVYKMFYSWINSTVTSLEQKPYRLLLVNYYLITNASCKFYNNGRENFIACFCCIMCENILPLLRNISLLTYKTISNRVVVTYNDVNIIFGDMPLNQNNKLENFIICHSKQYIFSCLLQSKTPQLFGLVYQIEMNNCIERYLSTTVVLWLYKRCSVLKFFKPYQINIFHIQYLRLVYFFWEFNGSLLVRGINRELKRSDVWNLEFLIDLAQILFW